MKEFFIGRREAGQRMDKYLFKALDRAPKSFVYKMLRKKNITLNGKKAAGGEILKESDCVRIYFSDETFAAFSSMASGKQSSGGPESRQMAERELSNDPEGRQMAERELSPEIVYEDEDILILNKPAGLLSQKASPADYSANEWVIDYLLTSGQLTRQELGTFRPSVCNRLDRNTSGLLTAGKTVRGLQTLSELLKSRSLQKYYHCLVLGDVKEEAHLTGYLCKDPHTNQVKITKNEAEISREQKARPAAFIETEYRPIRRLGEITLLEVHLITGRSHQIRAHLASIGHPILGDAKYGEPAVNRRLRKACGLFGQALHACRMEFPDGRVAKAPDPEIFARIISAWTEKG